MPLNLIFTNPGTYTIEDNGIPGDNTSVIKDGSGTVIFTFAHPADSLGFVNFEGGHDGYWPRVVKLHPNLKGKEYFDVPRGRVLRGSDGKFRLLVPKALAESRWIDVPALARSAGHLAEADEALDWAVAREWSERVSEAGSELRYLPGEAPRAITLRVAEKAIACLGGTARGSDVARLIERLELGEGGNLAGRRAALVHRNHMALLSGGQGASR